MTRPVLERRTIEPTGEDDRCPRGECAALYYGPDDDVPPDEQGNL